MQEYKKEKKLEKVKKIEDIEILELKNLKEEEILNLKRKFVHNITKLECDLKGTSSLVQDFNSRLNQLINNQLNTKQELNNKEKELFDALENLDKLEKKIQIKTS